MRRLQTPIIPMIGFLFLLLPLLMSTAYGANYKNWIPLLPESLNGLEKSGKPNGTNVKSEGETWSTLEQMYSNGSGKKIRLTIVNGTPSPEVRQFQDMKQFAMETDEKFLEKVDVSGHEGVLELYKKGGEGTLLISIREKTTVVLHANSIESKEALMALAGDLPLSEIASAAAR